MRKNFPFMLHRTLAEVDETERLRRWRGRNVHVVSNNWWGAARLRELEARAVEPGALCAPLRHDSGQGHILGSGSEQDGLHRHPRQHVETLRPDGAKHRFVVLPFREFI